MPSCSLLELPEEILELVLAHVRQFSDRLNICMTCKTLQRLNEKNLYRDLRFRGKLSPKQLLQFFSHRRHVTPYVQCLSLPPWGRQNDYEIDNENVPLIQEIDPPEEYFVFKRLYDGRWKVASVVSVVLALCPNLVELECRGIQSDVVGFWFRGLDCAARGMPWPNSFSSLVRLSLEDYDFTNGPARDIIHKCLRIPSLREFRVCNFTCWSQSDREDAFSELDDETKKTAATIRTSSVEHLEFIRGTMSTRTIKDIILMVQGTLKSFHLVFKRHRHAPIEFSIFNLIISLSCVAHSLTSLEITSHPSEAGGFVEGTWEYFRKLVNLKYLRCDLEQLLYMVYDDNYFHNFQFGVKEFAFGMDFLPQSLESLDLLNCRKFPLWLTSTLPAYVGVLIAAKRDRKLPNLKSIAINGYEIEWCPQRVAGMGAYRRTITPWKDGRAVSLGCRPKSPGWITRDKSQLRKLWMEAREAQIQLSAEAPDITFSPRDGFEVVMDEDPFGLL